ncbi:MAG: hypothetical protein ACYCOU_12725 [Sulfobacillus sp.]
MVNEDRELPLVLQQVADLFADSLDASPQVLESVFVHPDYAREVFENSVSCIRLLSETPDQDQRHNLARRYQGLCR